MCVPGSSFLVVPWMADGPWVFLKTTPANLGFKEHPNWKMLWYIFIYIQVNYNKYVHIYIYTCVYMHMFTFIYIVTIIYIYIHKHAFIYDIHICIHTYVYVYMYTCIYIYMLLFIYMHNYVVCSKSSRILQVSCAEVFGTFEGLLKLRLARGIWKTRVSFIYLHHTLAINVGDSPFLNKGFFNVGILYHPTISGNQLKHGTPPRNKKTHGWNLKIDPKGEGETSIDTNHQFLGFHPIGSMYGIFT